MTNAELWARREAAVARGVGTMHARFTSHAKNAELWDIEGKRYIDFATGIAVNNTGHSDPRIVDAVKAQLDNFSHSCYQVNPYESYISLAEKLNKLAPGQTPKKSIFLTTGAEAVENAIKIARAATGRPGIIAFKGGFHGRTMMGMALTGKVAPYKIGFGPFPTDVFHAPYPIDYHGVTEADSLQALDGIFKADIEPSRVAAIILEPVQGEGGFYAASPSFMKSLRSICDEHGILLICDEIQTGFARTGRMFATLHSNVEPDLMTVAKAMAGGFPISGVVGKADIMDAAAPGGLGGTYGGSPLGCVAGLKVLEIIEEDGLCSRANEIGDL
ncbi:MAG: aminotransferase class III-fold pyridoxal phosphate-dependent enzyme, partial [Alphaproteobacteria bacterium]|nr:aminotransferase class III-fold pyridoxal phosphate-dependent enzyme [Alphaproteobacteria bacterium]